MRRGGEATRARFRKGSDGFRRLTTRRCESQKVGYLTRSDALEGAETAMLKGYVSPGCHLTPYACGQCQQWHLYNRVIVPLS